MTHKLHEIDLLLKPLYSFCTAPPVTHTLDENDHLLISLLSLYSAPCDAQTSSPEYFTDRRRDCLPHNRPQRRNWFKTPTAASRIKPSPIFSTIASEHPQHPRGFSLNIFLRNYNNGPQQPRLYHPLLVHPFIHIFSFSKHPGWWYPWFSTTTTVSFFPHLLFRTGWRW